MSTSQLYRDLGVSGYEHEACCRKDGVFICECVYRLQAVGVRSVAIWK